MRLLEASVGVAAAVGEGDDVRPRTLRLQEEGREIRGADRVAHRSDDLAARSFDRRGAIGFQVFAEGVVGGDEEPVLAAPFGDRLAEADAEE